MFLLKWLRADEQNVGKKEKNLYFKYYAQTLFTQIYKLLDI